MKKELKNESPEAKIAEIEKGLIPLEKESKKIVIKNFADVQNATSFLAKIKKYADRVNELQSFFTDPYVEQRRVALDKKREIEIMFAPRLLPLNKMLIMVKHLISDYTLEEERKARAEEDRKQKIRDIANAKREEKGESQILEPVKTVERINATVKTAEGRTTTKKVWKFEVLETAVLFKDPQFLVNLYALVEQKDLHSQVLRGMVKNGSREVGGVRIYEDIEVSVSAN